VVCRREWLASLAWRRFLVVALVVALVAVAGFSSLRLEGVPNITRVLAPERVYKEDNLHKFCKEESKTPEPDLSKAWTPDRDYYKEEVCYNRWLVANCKSLADCPRPPREGGNVGAPIWRRLRQLTRKNMVLTRLLYLFRFFCEKHKLRWGIHYGAVLGAMRHRSVIPHDNDLDIWLEPKGFAVLWEHYHADFPRDVVLHHEANRLFIRDLNSCRRPRSTNPFWGFALDIYGHLPADSTSGGVVPVGDFDVTVGVGRPFPGVVMSKKKLTSMYGGDYLTYNPHVVKSMDSDFSAGAACPAVDPTALPGCGIEDLADGTRIRKKHYNHTTCWKVKFEGGKQLQSYEVTHEDGAGGEAAAAAWAAEARAGA